MTVPLGVHLESGGPTGYSYAAVLVREEKPTETREQLIEVLRRIRFSGWLAPPAEDGWFVVITAADGTVASGRRGVVGVAETVAEALSAPTVAVRVLDDKQLVLVAWESGQEVARYVSDPSREPRSDEDVLPNPLGSESADAIAAVCGRPEAAEALGELLAEPLDPDEEIESERLGGALRLLTLPSWLVTAWRGPRAAPAGPGSRHLLRLGAGRSGVVGWGAGRAAGVGRRWRPPPPVLLDPPRGGGPGDPAMWF